LPFDQDISNYTVGVNNASTIQKLEKFANVDQIVKSVAVNALACNSDAYPNNNYYQYHNPVTGQFDVLIYDLHFSFGLYCQFTTGNFFPGGESAYSPAVGSALVAKYHQFVHSMVKDWEENNALVNRMNFLFNSIKNFTNQVFDDKKLERMVGFPDQWNKIQFVQIE